MAFFDKIGDKAKGLVDSAKITYKVSEERASFQSFMSISDFWFGKHTKTMPNRRQNLFPYLTGYARFMLPSKSLRQSFRALSPKSTLTLTAAATATENVAAARMIPPPRIRPMLKAVMPQMSMNAAAAIFMPLTAQFSAPAAAVRLISFPLSARAAAISFPPTTPQNPIVRQSVIALHAVPS